VLWKLLLQVDGLANKGELIVSLRQNGTWTRCPYPWPPCQEWENCAAGMTLRSCVIVYNINRLVLERQYRSVGQPRAAVIALVLLVVLFSPLTNRAARLCTASSWYVAVCGSHTAYAYSRMGLIRVLYEWDFRGRWCGTTSNASLKSSSMTSACSPWSKVDDMSWRLRMRWRLVELTEFSIPIKIKYKGRCVRTWLQMEDN